MVVRPCILKLMCQRINWLRRCILLLLPGEYISRRNPDPAHQKQKTLHNVPLSLFSTTVGLANIQSVVGCHSPREGIPGRYTLSMDRVRFGRALGQGTREAARALLKAADAATAANPNPSRTISQSRPSVAAPVRQTAQTVRTTTAGVKEGSKRFGAALWQPFARISGVVLLEVTGVLFSLFALVSGFEAWQHRRDFQVAGPARTHLVLACAMFLVFAYFTLSSFIRAGRRNRR